MLIETYLYSKQNNIENYELTDKQRYMVYMILLYYIITIIVAIKYPIGNNIPLSLILAVFFSTIFWIFKIFSIISNNKNDKVVKKSAKTKNYYKPIY